MTSERNNSRKVNKTGHDAHGIIIEVDNWEDRCPSPTCPRNCQYVLAVFLDQPAGQNSVSLPSYHILYS